MVKIGGLNIEVASGQKFEQSNRGLYDFIWVTGKHSRLRVVNSS